MPLQVRARLCRCAHASGEEAQARGGASIERSKAPMLPPTHQHCTLARASVNAPAGHCGGPRQSLPASGQPGGWSSRPALQGMHKTGCRLVRRRQAAEGKLPVDDGMDAWMRRTSCPAQRCHTSQCLPAPPLGRSINQPPNDRLISRSYPSRCISHPLTMSDSAASRASVVSSCSL